VAWAGSDANETYYRDFKSREVIIIIIIVTFLEASEAKKTPKILPLGTIVKYV